MSRLPASPLLYLRVVGKFGGGTGSAGPGSDGSEKKIWFSSCGVLGSTYNVTQPRPRALQTKDLENMTTKTPVRDRRPALRPDELNIEVLDAKDVIEAARTRSSVYDKLVAAALNLQPSKRLVLKVPDSREMSSFYMSVRNALKRAQESLDDSTQGFRTAKSVDGQYLFVKLGKRIIRKTKPTDNGHDEVEDLE